MTNVRQSGPPATDSEATDVIQVDLARVADMFERPTVELGSSCGTFQPGIDLCIAELEGRPTGRPVHLEITLPRSEISDGLDERLAVTMRRYCDEQSYTNTCKRRSTQHSGGARPSVAACARCASASPSRCSASRSPRPLSTSATATILKPP